MNEAEIGSIIAVQRKSQKQSFFPSPSYAPYDHFQDVRPKGRTAAGRTKEKNAVLEEKKVHGMCARQSTERRLLVERTTRSSSDTANWLPSNDEGQQFEEQVYGEEGSQ